MKELLCDRTIVRYAEAAVVGQLVSLIPCFTPTVRFYAFISPLKCETVQKVILSRRSLSHSLFVEDFSIFSFHFITYSQPNMMLYNLPENGMKDYLSEEELISVEKEQQKSRISVFSGRAKLHYPAVDLFNRLQKSRSVVCLGPSG